MTDVVKNCGTCAHRKGSYTFGICMVSGYHCSVERTYPTVCGRDFDRWEPREVWYVRLVRALLGHKAATNLKKSMEDDSADS